MTRRINLSQIGSFSTEKYEQLLRVVVLEVDGRLKLGSPVDTGRFRMSWQVSENGTAGGMQPAGDYDKSEYATAEETQSAISIARVGYQQERAGNSYHIHNNLPYAEPVAYGTSLPSSWGGQYRTKQGTIPGYPDLIAREMTQWARAEADKLGRAD
jgi:hypothetical protein